MTIQDSQQYKKLSEALSTIAELKVPENLQAIALKYLLSGDGPDRKSPDDIASRETEHAVDGKLNPRTQNWMKQHDLNSAHIDSVFFTVDDEIEIITNKLPGTSKQANTKNVYLLCGAMNLLQNGDSNFSDSEARQICKKVGCYNEGNHATFVKGLGNAIAGDKSRGYTLTNPGLKQAADLIKIISAM